MTKRRAAKTLTPEQKADGDVRHQQREIASGKVRWIGPEQNWAFVRQCLIERYRAEERFASLPQDGGLNVRYAKGTTGLVQ